jgi:hypothetical protein
VQESSQEYQKKRDSPDRAVANPRMEMVDVTVGSFPGSGEDKTYRDTELRKARNGLKTNRLQTRILGAGADV